MAVGGSKSLFFSQEHGGPSGGPVWRLGWARRCGRLHLDNGRRQRGREPREARQWVELALCSSNRLAAVLARRRWGLENGQG